MSSPGSARSPARSSSRSTPLTKFSSRARPASWRSPEICSKITNRRIELSPDSDHPRQYLLEPPSLAAFLRFLLFPFPVVRKSDQEKEKASLPRRSAARCPIVPALGSSSGMKDEACRDQTDSLNHILICYESPLLEGLRVFRRACEIRRVLKLRENK